MTTRVLGVSFQYSHTIGRYDIAGPGFLTPVAMALGAGDTIYVVSRSYEHRPDGMRVTICTVDEEYIGEFGRGVTIAGETEPLAADGSLIWPTSIAIDREGNVYVADEWLNRISVFTKDGDWIGKWGTPGDSDGQIDRPSGLAFDQHDNLFLVDSGNNRVQRFTKDGTYLAKWGIPGNGDGQLNLPWGIDIDSQGNVWIADWRNDRIQKFTADGQFLMKLGGSGSGDGQFHRPTGVAVDAEGLIYVADWGNERLQIFSEDGSFITTLTGDGSVSRWGKNQLDANSEMWQEREIAQDLDREKLFWGAIAVDVDDDGRVFVVESARHRIQVYRKQAPMFFGGRL